jgi:hypothetical protein
VAEYAVSTVASGSDVVVMVSGAACTVSIVLPLTPPKVAEMVVLPALAPVANPPVSMVATVVLEEAQVTWLVRSCVELSE